MVTTIGLDAAGDHTSVAATDAAGPQVADFSFEQPDQGTNAPSNYAYVPGGAPGVQFTANIGIADNGSAWRFAAAPNGKQVAFLQSFGAMALR